MTRQPMNDQPTGAKPQRGSATEGRASSISQHMMEEIRGRAIEASIAAWDKQWGATHQAVAKSQADVPALLSSLQAAQARVGVLDTLMRDLFDNEAVQVSIGGNPITVSKLDERIRQALSEGGGT